MKKFRFPLKRVLDWRRTQASIEEMKLNRLYAELREIEDRLVDVRAERSDSERSLFETRVATGSELAALDAFKKSAAAECTRLENLAEQSRRRIARQIDDLSGKRRDARLLENLEQRKLAEWKLELQREVDREAEESHRARLGRDSVPLR